MIKKIAKTIKTIIRNFKNLFKDSCINNKTGQSQKQSSDLGRDIEDTLENRLSHWNGYIREKAILGIESALRRDDLIKVFNILLTRANDWVPEVRAAALKKIDELIKFIPPSTIIEILPKVYHLQKCSRANHESLISMVEDNLLKAPTTILLDEINNNDKIISRACFSIIIKKKLLPVLSIIETGINSSDIIIKLKASDLLKNLTREQFDDLYPKLYKIKCMSVRREIIRVCAQFDSEVSPRIMQGLLDQSKSVAFTAIYYARKLGFDLHGFYLDVLNNYKLYSQKQIMQITDNITELKMECLYRELLNIFNEATSMNIRLNALNALINYSEFDFNKEIITLCVNDDLLCAVISNRLLEHLPRPVPQVEKYYDLLKNNNSFETKRLVVTIVLRVYGFWNAIIAIMNIHDRVSAQDFELLGLNYLVSNFKYKHVSTISLDKNQHEYIQKWIEKNPDEKAMIELLNNNGFVSTTIC